MKENKLFPTLSCEQKLGFKSTKAREVSHWTGVQICCSCKNSDSSNGSAAMACRKPHAFPWEGAWSFTKTGFFNLQADLWAFHGSRSALNLQSGVNSCLLPVLLHLSCFPLCWLLMPSYCLRSPAASQKTPHQYSEPHSFSLRSFARLLCWTGRKAGANWKNSIS